MCGGTDYVVQNGKSGLVQSQSRLFGGLNRARRRFLKLLMEGIESERTKLTSQFEGRPILYVSVCAYRAPYSAPRVNALRSVLCNSLKFGRGTHEVFFLLTVL